MHLIGTVRTDMEVISAEHFNFLSFHCLNIVICIHKPLGNKKRQIVNSRECIFCYCYCCSILLSNEMKENEICGSCSVTEGWEMHKNI